MIGEDNFMITTAAASLLSKQHQIRMEMRRSLVVTLRIRTRDTHVTWDVHCTVCHYVIIYNKNFSCWRQTSTVRFNSWIVFKPWSSHYCWTCLL